MTHRVCSVGLAIIALGFAAACGNASSKATGSASADASSDEGDASVPPGDGGSPSPDGAVYEASTAPDGGDASEDSATDAAGPTVGATTPFVSYEAEDGTLGGGATVSALTTPTTEYSSPELESSGHAFVNLGTMGDYVEWVNRTGK